MRLLVLIQPTDKKTLEFHERTYNVILGATCWTIISEMTAFTMKRIIYTI